ncbi:HEXXH motif-containing protein [Kribbella sp. VKM Ac-2527]|uniref:HEXXH motif-containing protein n=1 Tax=Kribbella caucasensis TaxID=2512215 RepID=A0A4R6J5B9_9ACTN|nr:HEXXH motif-containing putative peptide modification protein [Kribbella sp. VKM Ac-2527]TDO30217.1 HEXXH motif-containing protein [Kribbella sp. VKM Ac-2527]
MTVLTEETQLGSVLCSFAEHDEFGYSPSIVSRALAVLASGVQSLSGYLDPPLQDRVSRLPLDWLCILERDPVVRSATEQALSDEAHAGTVAPDCALSELLTEILDSLARRSDQHSTGEAMPQLPTVAAMTGTWRIGPPAISDAVHVLSPNMEDSPVSSTFWRMFREFIHDSEHPEDELLSPAPKHVDVLQTALNTLCEVVPELASGVFAHAPTLCIVTDDCTFKSMSHRQFPGTIFLSERSLDSVWTTADALLHEALHHKLLDLHLISSMVRAEVAGDDFPMVVSPWNAPPNEWILGRALFAFHVYAHLTAFAACARVRRSDSSPSVSELAQMQSVAGRRAHYLGSRVVEVGEPVLSPRGHRLCQWLMHQTMALDDGSFALGPI